MRPEQQGTLNKAGIKPCAQAHMHSAGHQMDAVVSLTHNICLQEGAGVPGEVADLWVVRMNTKRDNVEGCRRPCLAAIPMDKLQ